MKNFSDVVVVGGGPCGSFCALNTAKKGISVTVFEEHSEIGFPCHCAGHLSINGLKNLGLYPLPQGIIENTFYGAKIYSPKGLEFSIRFPLPITCAVDRSLFDKHISQLAKEAGVRYFLGSRVESLTTEKNSGKGVVVKQGGKNTKFFCNVVVDAEGTSYRILKQAGLVPPPRENFVHCVNAYVEGVENFEPDIVEVFLGNAYAPGFYAWLIPKGEDRAKVGLGTKNGNPRTLLRKLMRKHPTASKRFRKAKILHESFHPIPLGGPLPRAHSDGFLAVGDAAAQVKPTTGGGIIVGLNCAGIAADVVAEAVSSKDFSSKFLSIYPRRFMKLLSFDIKAMLKARKMLNRISDERLDEFIGLIKKIHLEEDLKNFIEIDFQGRVLIKAWRRPRIIVALLYLLLLSFGNV